MIPRGGTESSRLLLVIIFHLACVLSLLRYKDRPVHAPYGRLCHADEYRIEKHPLDFLSVHACDVSFICYLVRGLYL